MAEENGRAKGEARGCVKGRREDGMGGNRKMEREGRKQRKVGLCPTRN